jgi:hypothetical protein
MSGNDVTWEMVAGWLVKAGVWERVEGGFKIHDYDEYQPSKEKVIQERQEAQLRMSTMRSKTVRANNQRTKPEQSPKFNLPVPVPVPVPVPNKVIDDVGINGDIDENTPGYIPTLVPTLIPQLKDEVEEEKNNDNDNESMESGHLAPLAAAFTQATNLPPFMPNPRSYLESLENMHIAGVQADDIKMAVQSLRDKEYTIVGPKSVINAAVAEMGKRLSGGNGNGNHRKRNDY